MQPFWGSVASQVLKLETRQVYDQTGNASYEQLAAGNLRRAIELIPVSVQGDADLYRALRERRVDFVRCRPVEYPLTDYLFWELQHYAFNSREGERIFCLPLAAHRALFNEYATHDFMVFDATVGFVHDYDDSGRIRGGWVLEDSKDVLGLIQLFGWIRSCAAPFDRFLGDEADGGL